MQAPAALIFSVLVSSMNSVPAVSTARKNTGTWRRMRGILVVAIYLVFVTIVSAFFYPIWTGQQVPFWFWQLHIWLPSCR